MIIDPINQLTRETVQVCVSKNASFNSGVLDARDYIGRLVFIVSAGLLTTGDSNGTLNVVVYDSANNSSFATTGVYNTFTNVAATKTISLDTRDVSRYLMCVCTVAGGNTPTRPVAIEVIGTKQSQ